MQPREYHHIVETGDWAADNRAGREAAIICIRHMVENGTPNHLCQVVRGMISKGRFGGVEVGFFTAIGIMLIE